MEKSKAVKKFATFMKDKRMALGLSQEQLALKVYGNEKERSRISRFENGKKVPGLDTMGFILEALGCDFEFTEHHRF